MNFESINPANGKTIKSYPVMDNKELQYRLRNAEVIWKEWRKNDFSKYSLLLKNLSEKMTKKKEELSRLISIEMGKPLNQSMEEIEKCILLTYYYAEHGRYFLEPRKESLSYKKSYVYYAPLGGVFGIMPWNFPFWQVFRFAIPALCAGNAVFLKHSENVTGCALALENLFSSSDWPIGIFNTLVIQKNQVESVISNPFIQVISFTGSQKVGSFIASLCGKYIKKSILELGGSDPYIVLEDANIKQAADLIVQSRLKNSGQSCIAAKRIIVEKSIYNNFIEEIKKTLKLISISHPAYNPDVGPLAKKEFIQPLNEMKKDALQNGAEIIYEKSIDPKEDSGFYFPITCLGSCHGEMKLASQESFGPLFAIFPVENEKAAIQLANKSQFGLGASIFTQNQQKGELWARDYLEAGSCFVNAIVRSHPLLPFGGIKGSGYGRELSSEGIREFTNIKTIVVE